jgi:hypothetical protein
MDSSCGPLQVPELQAAIVFEQFLVHVPSEPINFL